MKNGLRVIGIKPPLPAVLDSPKGEKRESYLDSY